ncbi:MAG: low specificity L-threonine aldolase [Hyphomicrobiaceae bacterium]
MIDLYSDTQTRPSAEMRAAMAAAEVGDEQLGEDPTAKRLCARVAGMFGKEAAVFLPSGTMCNLISVAVVCQPGSMIITSALSHLLGSECGGLAAVAGAFPRIVPCQRGIYTGEDVRRVAGTRKKRNTPVPAMIWVEQTVNRGGGVPWTLAQLADVTSAAAEYGLHRHMDGARVLNAAAALSASPQAIAAGFDSVWLDLTKGLGCPVGAVLAGSADFIERAWIWKQRLGGAWRQSGMLAAAGLYALDHNAARMAEDHVNAALLASEIRAIPGCKLMHEPVATNLVFFDVQGTGLSADDVARGLRDKNVRIGVEGATSLRAVTHIELTREAVLEASAALRAVVSGR